MRTLSGCRYPRISRRRDRLDQRQGNPRPSALAKPARELNRAAVLFDNLAGRRQPEPGPKASRAEQRLECLLEDFGRDTRTVIADIDLGPAAPEARTQHDPRRAPEVAGFVESLHRVVEDITERATHPGRIDRDDGRRTQIELRRYWRLAGEARGQLQQPVVETMRTAMQGGAVRILQEIADDAIAPIGAALDPVQRAVAG